MSGCNGLWSVVILACLIFPNWQSRSFVHGQHFDSNVDDKSYLDQLEVDVQAEVDAAKSVLVHQAKYTEDVARNYIGVKLKENLFKALRILADKERQEIKQDLLVQDRKQTKQEDEEDEDGGGAAGAQGTTRRPNNILPVIGNLVKAIFGGNTINLTAYVESATNFLPNPIGSQIVGVVKLIGHNPSRTTTPASIKTTIITVNANNTQAVVNMTSLPVNATIPGVNGTAVPTEKLEGAGGAEEEEEEEEESRRGGGRQLSLPNLTTSLNFLGTLFGGRPSTERPAAAAPVQTVRRRASPRPAAATNSTGTTESASGFEEEREDPMQQFSLEGLATSVRNGLGDMIRIAPDLFKGAREAVNLITGLQGLIGGLDIL